MSMFVDKSIIDESSEVMCWARDLQNNSLNSEWDIYEQISRSH